MFKNELEVDKFYMIVNTKENSETIAYYHRFYDNFAFTAFNGIKSTHMPTCIILNNPDIEIYSVRIEKYAIPIKLNKEN